MFGKGDKNYIRLLEKENDRLKKENNLLRNQQKDLDELKIEYNSLIDSVKKMKQRYKTLLSNLNKIQVKLPTKK